MNRGSRVVVLKTEARGTVKAIVKPWGDLLVRLDPEYGGHEDVFDPLELEVM